jgi:hypothetical protein
LFTIKSIETSGASLDNFASGQTSEVARLEKSKAYGQPSVSSDGRWIFYWQVDQIDNDIMLLEGFH